MFKKKLTISIIETLISVMLLSICIAFTISMIDKTSILTDKQNDKVKLTIVSENILEDFQTILLYPDLLPTFKSVFTSTETIDSISYKCKEYNETQLPLVSFPFYKEWKRYVLENNLDLLKICYKEEPFPTDEPFIINYVFKIIMEKKYDFPYKETYTLKREGVYNEFTED